MIIGEKIEENQFLIFAVEKRLRCLMPWSRFLLSRLRLQVEFMEFPIVASNIDGGENSRFILNN